MAKYWSNTSTDWPTYINALKHYRLRYPTDWIVNEESNERVIIKDPTDRAQFIVNYLSQNCNSVQSTLTGKASHLNYYLQREFKIQVGEQKVDAYEFFDTITGTRETRVLIPSDGGCYDTSLRRLDLPDQQRIQSTLEVILGSFRLSP
jgi:hypothetical protein